MRRNHSRSQAICGSRMWYNSDAYYAEKRYPMSFNGSRAPLRSMAGQANPFLAPQYPSRSSSYSPQRRRLLGSTRNMFLASTPRLQTKSQTSAPCVVDMQLPIHNFEALQLNHNPRSNGSMQDEKLQNVAPLTTKTFEITESKEILMPDALPLIMVDTQEKRRRPIKTSRADKNRRYSKTPVTSKEREDILEQQTTDVKKPAEPEDGEAVEEIKSEPQAETEVEADATKAHDQLEKNIDFNHTVKCDCLEFQENQVSVREEIENENKLGVVAACEVTEAQYISFDCDHLNQANAEDLDLEESCFWKPAPTLYMSSFMSPGQLGKTSCMNNENSFGCQQCQSQSINRMNSSYPCNNFGWNRPTCMQQQQQQQYSSYADQQMQHNSFCNMASHQRESSNPRPKLHQVPVQSNPCGLTEMLAQQLQNQMKQAQAHIDRVQMQLNQVCAAKRMQALPDRNENTCCNSKANEIERNAPMQNLQKPTRRHSMPCAMQPRLMSIDTANGSAENKFLTGTGPQVLAFGFYPMNDENKPHTSCFNSAALAQHQRISTPQQNPMPFLQQQQFQLQQQQQQQQQPQLSGNQYRPPCFRPRYAKMRFMMPRCWPGGQ